VDVVGAVGVAVGSARVLQPIARLASTDATASNKLVLTFGFGISYPFSGDVNQREKYATGIIYFMQAHLPVGLIA